MPDESLDITDLMHCLNKNKDGSIEKLAVSVMQSFASWFHTEKWPDWTNEDLYVRFAGERAHGIYLKLRDAEKSDGAALDLDVEHLAHFIKRVGMPPKYLLGHCSKRKPVPFLRFRSGTNICVCIAQRYGRYEEGDEEQKGRRRLVHGARDVLALADLVDLLGRELRLEYQLKLIPVAPSPQLGADPTSDIGNAEKQLDKLLEDPHTGAIISLGSGPHNLVSRALAKRIFSDYGQDEISVRFRWASPRWKSLDFLKETSDLAEQFQKHKEGLWYYQGRKCKWLLPRDTEEQVDDKLARATTKKIPYLYDCGLLAIDVREQVPLILAAGHTGNSTRICVKALGETEYIAAGMHREKRNRFIDCVDLALRKPLNTKAMGSLPDKRGQSWYFVHDSGRPPDMKCRGLIGR